MLEHTTVLRRFLILPLLLLALLAACSGGGDEAGGPTGTRPSTSTDATPAFDIEALPTGRLVDREGDGLRLAPDLDSDPYYERMLVVGPQGLGEIEVLGTDGQPFRSDLRAGLHVAVDVGPRCAESYPVQCEIERVVVLSEDDDPEVVGALDQLTKSWPCATAFWVSNTKQTVALEIEFIGDAEPNVQTYLEDHSATLPSPEWRAVITQGRDLFTNWCTDLPADDRHREVVDEWPVVAGSIEVTWHWADPPTSGPAVASLRGTGLMVEAPSGERLLLGDITIDNDCWMCAAG
jgi:hypothetical protein